MERNEKFAESDASALKGIKKMAGERIRQERKARRITQAQLAATMGVSLRWLREIEAGAAMTHIDDHLKAAYRLGLSTGHIALPILYMGQGMRFPPQLINSDLLAIERGCLTVIADIAVSVLKRDLSPE
jgi:transcriptional regulator with XRE-family HTH domain